MALFVSTKVHIFSESLQQPSSMFRSGATLRIEKFSLFSPSLRGDRRRPTDRNGEISGKLSVKITLYVVKHIKFYCGMKIKCYFYTQNKIYTTYCSYTTN